MEEWKEYKLGEILAEKGYIRGPFGSALKRGDMKSSGIPVYEQQHAIYQSRDFRFFIDDNKFNEMKRFQVQENDILISCSGTVGKVTIISKDDPKGIISQALLTLRVNPKLILPEYLKYFFTSQKGYNAIISRSSGSVQVNIAKRDVIEQIPINLPPLPTQQKIAAILSSLDDKIELNNKINENLEQQAQALFKSWFVDFEPFGGKMPEDWNEIKVGTLPIYVSDYVANGSFADLKENVQLYQEENYAYFIRNTDLKNNSFNTYVDEHSYNFLEKSRLNGGELIISNVGDVGSVYICPTLEKPMTLGNNIIMLRCENEIYRYYLYMWFKWFEGKNRIHSITGGSVLQKFNKTDFKNMLILEPSIHTLEQFEKMISPYFELIIQNTKQSQSLANLRNVLLPKIMSGEIEV